MRTWQYFKTFPKYVIAYFKGTVCVGGLKPLWACRNTRRENHDSVYALWSACKTSSVYVEQNTAIKITGRSKNKDPDNNTSICSHMYYDLNPEIVESYFYPAYVQKRIKDKAKIPTECTLCSIKLIKIIKSHQNTKWMCLCLKIIFL